MCSFDNRHKNGQIVSGWTSFNYQWTRTKECFWCARDFNDQGNLVWLNLRLGFSDILLNHSQAVFIWKVFVSSLAAQGLSDISLKKKEAASLNHCRVTRISDVCEMLGLYCYESSDSVVWSKSCILCIQQMKAFYFSQWKVEVRIWVLIFRIFEKGDFLVMQEGIIVDASLISGFISDWFLKSIYPWEWQLIG